MKVKKAVSGGGPLPTLKPEPQQSQCTLLFAFALGPVPVPIFIYMFSIEGRYCRSAGFSVALPEP